MQKNEVPATTSGTLPIIVVAAVLGLFCMLLGSAPAWANPYFATQTGRQCSSCHQLGRETEGIHGLNATGRAFEQAFRACPTCALKKYSGGGTPEQHPTARRANCRSRFTCSDQFAKCFFRIFNQNGSTFTMFSIDGGNREVEDHLSRGQRYCFSARGFPEPGCGDRQPVNMRCD